MQGSGGQRWQRLAATAAPPMCQKHSQAAAPAWTRSYMLTRSTTQLPEGVDDGQAEHAGERELWAAGILRDSV